jgi:peptidoglycan-associated lipoprotein
VNEQLGMERARQVSAFLAGLNLPADKVAVESHGEKNLLVATPDNTDEPRNRRVEINVR